MPARKDHEGREAGFAMLVVFLLLAFIGIAMYNELPRVVLEAQRDREQLLIDRGEQYKRAIQLYYRKFQRYPPDLDALDKTNNIRFLRKRYKDPMTGEDNWRLITAAGPGIFLDSLVVAPPASQQSQTQTESASTTTPEDTPTPIWLQRRPSDMILAGNGVSMPPMPGAIETVSGQQPSYPTPEAPIEVASTAGDQPQPPDQGQPAMEGAATLPAAEPAADQTNADAASMALPPPVPTGPPPPGQALAVQPGVMIPVPVPGQTFPGQPGMQPPVPFVPGQPVANQGGPTTISAGMVTPGAQAANPALQMINSLLTTPNPRGAATVQPTVITQQPQQQLQRGIAGVASKLESESIKVYNDRSKYNEWEFLYDVRQDPQAMAAGRGQQQGQQGQQGGGTPGTIGPPGGTGRSGPGNPGGPGMFGPGNVISPGGLSPQQPSPGRGR